MITKHIFKLKEYYQISNKYYYFFDGMFRIKNESKLDSLKSLTLPSSTYRLNRRSKTIKNNHHNILLKYFDVASISDDKIEKEDLLSKAFSVIYYKQEEDYKIIQDSLEQFINENTYLKPIFILFRILFKIMMQKEITNILEILEEDVAYLTYFPEEYFDDELRIIYWIILFFSGKYNKCLKSQIINTKYPYLSWLYYHLCGSKYFYNNDYSKALIFYQSALKLYIKDFNIKRLLECQMNIGAMYNYLGEYSIAINTFESLVEHSIYQTDNFPLKCDSIMHYMISLMEIDDYETVLRVIRSLNEEIVNDITSMVGIVSSFLSAIQPKEILEVLKNKIETSKDVQSIYEFLYLSKSLPKDFKQNQFHYYIQLIINKIKFVHICQNRLN